MKKLLLLSILLVSVLSFAQSNGITYQAVIYSAGGESIPGIQNPNAPLVNKAICLQFSILDSDSQTEYQEKVSVTTDGYGMVNLVIGNGTQTGGYANSFSTIVWSSSQKFLKVSLDETGSCSAFELISNQLLTYVPFALAATSATSVSGVVGIANGGTNATTVLGAKTNLQLQNVDNTSDISKPLSAATQTALNTKVDKETGKGLSANDYTTVEKTKLAAITGVNTGDQDLSGYATLTNLGTKVDKETGKGLSANDYTTAEKTKLAAISGVNTGDQDLSGYATLTNLGTKVDKETGKGLSANDYTTAEKTKLAAITGVNTGDQDLSGYATVTNLALKANSSSPSFSGVPTAPTAVSGTNTTQLATTAFVSDAVTGKFVDVTTNQTIAGDKTFASNLYVPTGSVGIGSSSPKASAAFEITSTTKGFLPPRMTQVQRNAISNPANGLIIYCSDCAVSGEPQFYNGSSWKKLDGTVATSQISGTVAISSLFSTTNGTNGSQRGQSFTIGSRGGYLNKLRTNAIGGVSGQQLLDGIANSSIKIREYVNDVETGTTHALTGVELTTASLPTIIDYNYSDPNYPYYPTIEFKFNNTVFLNPNARYVIEFIPGNGVTVYCKTQDVFTGGQAYDIDGINLSYARDFPFELYLVNEPVSNYLPLTGGNITGTLGIGTTSNYANSKVHIAGNGLVVWGGTGTLLDASGNSHGYIESVALTVDGKAGSDILQMRDSSANSLLVVDKDGNMGIGTTSPSQKLEVTGNIKTSGKLTAGTITLPNTDGTSGQVLATNGAGVVAWSTPVSVNTSNFVDVTTNQTIAGAKTFSSNIIANLSGNASTASNIIGGTVGQLPYQTSSNTTSFLAANTSSTRKFLSSVGSTGSATAPSWQSLSPSDIVSSSSQTSGYLNFETGVFSAQNWTELNTQWTITSGWANTRNYNGTAYQGSYSINAPDSQDFTLQSSKDFNLASLFIKGDGMGTATSVEFKGYNAAGVLVGSVTVDPSTFNHSFSNVNLNFNGINKLVFHPIGFDPNAMGGGSFFLDYFDVSILTSNNLNSVNGILKSDGNGNITAAVAGTDYLNSTSLSNYLPLTGGTVSGSLGIGTNTANSSAALDVTSTTQGFLPPRMTQSQRNAIASPIAGLVVWCKNCGENGELQVFNGTNWANLLGGATSNPLEVGSSYRGGKIAYIFQSGDPGYVAGEFHGIIASNSDLSNGIRWGQNNDGLSTTYDCTNRHGTSGYALPCAIGAGRTNTSLIISSNTEVNPADYAAKICDNYSTVNNGVTYDDWFLPSYNEMLKVYQNKNLIGGLFYDTTNTASKSNWYWTSTGDVFQDRAADVNSNDGSKARNFRGYLLSVRAVRYF